MNSYSDMCTAEGGTDLLVFEWLRAIWQMRRTVCAVTVVTVLVALVYLRFATYMYTATLSVTPVESAGTGGLVSQLGGLGGLGGLASLAGINLPGGQGNASFQLYIEGMRSRAVADKLAEQQDVMAEIFFREWDVEKKTWHRPTGLLPALKYGLFYLVGAKGFGWHAPDGARLLEYLDDRLEIVQSTKKQVVNISYANADPFFAARFLSILNSIVDNRVRQKTLLRAIESIAYLNVKLNSVVNVEHQKAIAQALSEQEKLQMMASSTASFSAETFGEPKSSYRPTYPQPFAVLLFATILGIIIGSSGVLIRLAMQPRRTGLPAGFPV